MVQEAKAKSELNIYTLYKEKRKKVRVLLRRGKWREGG